MGTPPPISQIIRERRLKLDLSQEDVARIASVSHSYISKLESGAAPRPGAGTLQRIAAALRFRSIEGLLRGEEFEVRPGPLLNAVPVDEVRSPLAVRRPIFRWGAAGDPTNPDDAPLPDREDYPPLGRESLVGSRGFGVDVRGSSMTKRRIYDGDLVWVNPDRPYRSGDLVVAYVRDCRSQNGAAADGMVVKVFRKTGDGSALFNDGDEPYGQKWLDCQEFTIIGPVVLISPRPFPPQ